MDASSLSEKTHLLIATVGPAHGIRGEIKLHCHAGSAAAYQKGLCYHCPSKAPLTIQSFKAIKDGWAIVRFEEIANRDEAEALRGAELYLNRDLLPELDEEEYYYQDLVGLEARNAESGTRIGRVSALFNHGAGDLLEITLLSGAKEFLPFTREMVPEISLAGEYLTVLPPEGLWAAPPRKSGDPA